MLEIFVVIVDVSIASLKVTVRDVFGAIDEAESEGYVDEIVGAVVSVVLLSLVSSSVQLYRLYNCQHVVS